MLTKFALPLILAASAIAAPTSNESPNLAAKDLVSVPALNIRDLQPEGGLEARQRGQTCWGNGIWCGGNCIYEDPYLTMCCKPWERGAVCRYPYNKDCIPDGNGWFTCLR
ncbi:uncharacterized protein LOC62_04G006273 [Vanrija pseudolonga]|uniref:Uncharacterized protein n=1 Tax=Vanrija pseudolonga TaxID=143232 RepID=A0AAF1BLY2_9TREE|nr:hypothetical protein LOC62_04G006273 [Vanrija pseudolonga]